MSLDKEKKTIGSLFWAIVWFLLVIMFIGAVIASIMSLFGVGDKCWESGENPEGHNYTRSTSELILATGNYKGNGILDNYGQWKKMDFYVEKGSEIYISPSGTITLTPYFGLNSPDSILDKMDNRKVNGVKVGEIFTEDVWRQLERDLGTSSRYAVLKKLAKFGLNQIKQAVQKAARQVKLPKLMSQYSVGSEGALWDKLKTKYGTSDHKKLWQHVNRDIAREQSLIIVKIKVKTQKGISNPTDAQAIELLKKQYGTTDTDLMWKNLEQDSEYQYQFFYSKTYLDMQGSEQASVLKDLAESIKEDIDTEINKEGAEVATGFQNGGKGVLFPLSLKRPFQRPSHRSFVVSDPPQPLSSDPSVAARQKGFEFKEFMTLIFTMVDSDDNAWTWTNNWLTRHSDEHWYGLWTWFTTYSVSYGPPFYDNTKNEPKFICNIDAGKPGWEHGSTGRRINSSNNSCWSKDGYGLSATIKDNVVPLSGKFSDVPGDSAIKKVEYRVNNKGRVIIALNDPAAQSSSSAGDIQQLEALIKKKREDYKLVVKYMPPAVFRLDDKIINYTSAAGMSGGYIDKGFFSTNTSSAGNAGGKQIKPCSSGATMPVPDGSEGKDGIKKNYCGKDQAALLAAIKNKISTLKLKVDAAKKKADASGSTQKDKDDYKKLELEYQGLASYNDDGAALKDECTKLGKLIARAFCDKIEQDQYTDQIAQDRKGDPTWWKYEGGYNVYIKGMAAQGIDGQFLKVCVSDEEPEFGECPAPIAQASFHTKTPAPASGYLWFKIEDPGIGGKERYEDNSGAYNVRVTMVEEEGQFSKFVDNLITSIRDQVASAAEHIFKTMTCTGSTFSGEDGSAQCADFLKTVRAALMIYMIIYFIMFMFGMVEITISELFVRILKIAIIIVLLGENSWDFFYNNLFIIFTNSFADLLAAASGNGDTCGMGDTFAHLKDPAIKEGTCSPFQFLDFNIGMLIFKPGTFVKIFSLMLFGLMGIIYMVLIFYTIFTFFFVVINAIFVYCMSFIAIGMLLALAPIFICFILFQSTKHLFDKWITLMVRYSVEPLIMMVGLVLLNSMLEPFVASMLNFNICFKCAINMTLKFAGLEKWFGRLLCIPSILPWGGDNDGSGKSVVDYFSFAEILVVIILVKVMQGYIKFSGTLASYLTDTMTSESLTGHFGRDDMIHRGEDGQGKKKGFMAFVKRNTGMDDGSTGRYRGKRATDRKARANIAIERLKAENQRNQTKQ